MPSWQMALHGRLSGAAQAHHDERVFHVKQPATIDPQAPVRPPNTLMEWVVAAPEGPWDTARRRRRRIDRVEAM
jgi:hypothetical protein